MQTWRAITIRKLAWFCHQAPVRLRWRIEQRPGTNKLQIKTPNGWLDFKISGGCWVRKQQNG